MDKPVDNKKDKRDFLAEKIKELEERISKTKYNKKTQHAIGLYKAQLARLKEKQRARSRRKKGEGYAVRKTGDGTVVLLGFPSVGKSTLLNALTNANSPVGTYAFTTLTVIPGILDYKFAKIQVLDVPGVVHGAAAGTGRGKEVLAIIRNSDLIV
jgi:ribosome-interacting GTPase 1